MRCRYNHDGDCCNSGAAQYMCKCKKPCDNIVPITNADYIRSLSDEELAASIFIPCPHDTDGYGECKYGWHKREQSCEECRLEWLQQPAKEGE